MRIRVLTALVLVATCIVHGQQVRDRESAQPLGSGEVAGVVVDEAGQPIRRVFVELSLDRRAWRQAAVTSTDGRFAFANVPAGTYDLAATKPPFLPARYGATKPGGKGIPIVLADGARMGAVALKLVRGAAIAGRITNDRGEPSSNVVVRILRRSAGANGAAFEALDSGMYSITDHRGEYRLFGLPPGEYLVTAAPVASRQPLNIRLTTQADVDRVLRATRQNNSPVTSRNSPAAPPSIPTQDAATRTTVGIAPVYYPGTTNAALASVVALAVGEERTRIDFQTDVIRTSRVEGSVTSPDGPLPNGIFVTMVPTAFTRTPQALRQRSLCALMARFRSRAYSPVTTWLPQGQGAKSSSQAKALHARCLAGICQPARPMSTWSFGAAPVRVDGRDVSDVAVTIQRGLDCRSRGVCRHVAEQCRADVRRVEAGRRGVANCASTFRGSAGSRYGSVRDFGRHPWTVSSRYRHAACWRSRSAFIVDAEISRGERAGRDRPAVRYRARR